jgi:hypothetical protein
MYQHVTTSQNSLCKCNTFTKVFEPLRNKKRLEKGDTSLTEDMARPKYRVSDAIRSGHARKIVLVLLLCWFVSSFSPTCWYEIPL